MTSGMGDRLMGIAVVLGAIAYGYAATQLQVGFMTDPVGSKTFPLLVAATCALCGLIMIVKPDEDPEFPGLGTIAQLALSIIVMAGYAYALKPLGFLIPTAIAAGVLSWQIGGRPVFAVAAGLGLSVGLFLLFKFVLGLGLIAFPGA